MTHTVTRAPSPRKPDYRGLMSRFIADMLQHADSGEPIEDGTRWTCGRCLREDGVRQYVVRAPEADGGFRYRLVCPCCSRRACPHRLGIAAVA